MKTRTIALLAALVVLSGCAMIPKYARPQMPVPERFPAPASAGGVTAAAPQAAEIAWQDFFTDARMKSVIELALDNNRDLRVAALNIEKAGAYYRIQRSAMLPTVGVGAFGEKVRIPEKLTDSGRAEYSEQYSVNVGISEWELDFFGRLRSLKGGALARYLATDYAHRAAHLSLVAAVASGYLDLAADLENLQLAQATLDAQQNSADLVRKSFDLGVATGVDLHQAQSQVEASRAAVAAYSAAVEIDRNVLELLAGTPVPPELLPDGLESFDGVKEVSAGLPSEVLQNRPDILALEQQLIAANANIGAARAAFFPRVTLTATAGTLHSSVSGLFESGTRTWSFVPQILAPIFASGSLRANLRVSKIDREIAVADYEKAIQTAFAEVSNALVLRSALVEQEDAQRALVAELDEALGLSRARFDSGLDGYLGVLVAERSVYSARSALVETRRARQANLVELYKVLGGGT